MADASEEETSTNALELSDEEFANLDFDSLPEGEENTSEEEKEEETDEDEEEETTSSETTEETGDENSEEAEEEAGTAVSDASEEDTEEEEGDDTDPKSKSSTTAKKEPVEESDSEGGDPESKTSSDINYEEAYKKLLAPFKANGKDIQVANVEDAITLMQMGANYNKKMAGLKPNLKLLKMLENNNLLEEDKLSFLIDLDKKNPEAVARLMKESGIDPLDIDKDAPDTYTPNTYTVDDRSVELDGILDEIKDTKSYNETLDIIGNKWDTASKEILVNNPNIIKIINEHVESGTYQQIKQAVDNERMFGRLSGMSDLEAYKQVGDSINAKGGFKPTAETSPSILDKTLVKAKAKVVDTKLKSRKKAASSTKNTGKAAKEQFNPLAMSDDEFEKMSAGKFI